MGSAFSKVMVNMQLATETGGEKLQQFASVAGMSSSEFKKAFQEDATSAIIAFIKGLGDAESKGKSAIGILDDMGIKEVVLRDTLLRAAGASDVFTNAIEIGTSAWDENTALTNEAAQRYETLQSKIEILKNKFTDVGITIGNVLMPKLEKMVEWLGNAADWFSKLDESTQNTIIAIGSVVAAIGPILIIIGQMSIGISALIKGFTLFTTFMKTQLITHLVSFYMYLTTSIIPALTATAFSIGAVTVPVWAVIAAIAALIGIGVLLYKNWDTIKAKCIEVWGNVKEFTIQAWESIKTSLMNTWNSITESVTTTWNNITSTISSFWESIKTTTSDIWNSIKEVLSSVWQSIVDVISPFTQFISDIVSMTWNFISSTTTTIWNSIMGILKSVWDLIVAVVNLGVALIELAVTVAWKGIEVVTTTVWNAIKATITTIWNAISALATTVWNGIKNVITTVWNAIKPVVDTSVNFIKSIISTVFNAISSFITLVVNGWKNIISTVWNGIKTVVSTGANSVKSVISTVFNAISPIVSTVWNGIKNTISTVWNGIKTVVSTGANLVKSTISKVFNTLETILTAPFKAAERVISSILGGITGTINKVTSGINKVTSLFKMIEDPNQQQDIQLYSDDDYSQVKFNYANARQTTVSDAIAQSHSINETIRSFDNNIKSNNNSSLVSEFKDALKGITDTAKEIIVPVVLDGKEIAKVIAPYSDNVNGSRINLSERGLAL